MKNLFKTAYSRFEDKILSLADARKLNVYAVAKSSGRSLSTQINHQATTLQRETLNQWKLAVMTASDPQQPDKSALERLYKNMMQDNHLASVIDSRILYCQRSPFKIVNEKGDEKEDLSWLLERTWFEEFIKLVLLSRFEGTQLIELFDIIPDTKELAQIDPIPISFFNAKKGIITKNTGDTTGWDYKSGALSSYYIQVGKDRDLGMLADMAPVVLGKKLGWGSWMDYVETYGVPSIIVTSRGVDDASMNRLIDAMSNFKSNNYLGLREGETVQTIEAKGGNPDNFDKLINRANTEMSKRILGGSGLTDEKSFVGSAEIQFKLAKDRFESDKLLVKNVINQQLFPKLQKLSPVYSVLNGHYFEWDNTEVQSSEDVAKYIDVLAPHFELDIDQISQKTGFTVLAQKQSGTPEQEIPEIKKKSPSGK